MSRYVRRRTELGLDRIEVSVPQAHPPGAEAEVDFGEFHAMNVEEDSSDQAVWEMGLLDKSKHGDALAYPGRT